VAVRFLQKTSERLYQKREQWPEAAAAAERAQKKRKPKANNPPSTLSYIKYLVRINFVFLTTLDANLIFNYLLRVLLWRCGGNPFADVACAQLGRGKKPRSILDAEQRAGFAAGPPVLARSSVSVRGLGRLIKLPYSTEERRAHRTYGGANSVYRI
jgi:hypothetical protein